MIHPRDVAACLVTRGDRPETMDAILASLLPYGEVVVWDNAQRPRDWKCAGRYAAAWEASREVVYFQDDDVIVPVATQQALLAAYEPGVVCVANWGHGENPDGYDDLPLVCGGALVERAAIWDAIDRYSAKWPLDDEFAYEADFVVGALYPTFVHLREPFEIDYAIAQSPERLCNQPWQRDLKRKITNRARKIRDAE